MSKSPPSTDDAADNLFEESGDGGMAGGENIFRVLWRHRLLIALLTALASGLGYYLHREKPTTYRAANKLHIASDVPLVLDSSTGSVVGGVPDQQVLESLILSDKVLRVAANDPDLRALVGEDISRAATLLSTGLKFSSPQRQSRSGRVIAVLSYEGTNADLCVAAVNATSRAIEAYFESERASNINELGQLITRAEQKLLPQLEELEQQYESFRASAALEYASDGVMVNPHRERQAALRGQLIEIEAQRRKIATDLRLIRSISQREKDPQLAMQVIEQLGGSITQPGETGLGGVVSPQQIVLDQTMFGDTPVEDLRLRDLELQRLEVAQQLVPLEVELTKLRSDLADSHPAVRTLVAQIKTTKEKLDELAIERRRRVEEMRLEALAEAEGEDTKELTPEEKLAEAERQKLELQKRFVNGYVAALEQRLELIDDQMSTLDLQIEDEKLEADKLSKAEADDAMYQRKIERSRALLGQLEAKMAGLDISEVNNGVQVDPLYATVTPQVTGPNLGQDMMMFVMMGFGLGGLVSILLESNSKTYRSSKQVAEELRTNILAHIPLDDRAGTRKNSDATGDLATVHPNLSVVHRVESPTSESFRCLRTSLLFHSNRTKSKVYQITSPLAGDGKSTIAANLAGTLGQSGKRVLLIDLDLRSPRLTGRFGLAEELGVTQLLNEECELTDVIHQTPLNNVDVLPSGVVPENPAEALLLPEMNDLFAVLREQYDFILVDTPPLLLVTDPSIVTSYVDSAILAMRIVAKAKPNSREAIAILRNTEVEIAGVVINKADDGPSGSYYQIGADGAYKNVGYGYGSQYKKEQAKKKKKGEPEQTYRVVGRQHRLSTATVGEGSKNRANSTKSNLKASQKADVATLDPETDFEIDE